MNGFKVKGKTKEKVVCEYYCYSEQLAGGNWLTFCKDDIRDIVTKQQFEQMKYVVEE